MATCAAFKLREPGGHSQVSAPYSGFTQITLFGPIAADVVIP